MIYITSLLTGLAVWIIFTLLKLPVPAPNVLPWVLGIIGIYLGAVLTAFLVKKYFG